jgi:hypothetical protein
MAQLKQVCTVTNGSQTVTVIGTNVAYRILKNSVFMTTPDLVPYIVAQDASFDGVNTVVTLTGAYQGASGAMANGVFATDFTVPDGLPLISQGDVGTAAIWTNTMYKIQALMTAVSPTGLVASVNDIHASLASALAARDAASASQTAAKTSETNSAASAAAALASQNAAKTSETNSKTSETNSKTSETNSSSSKTAAAGSATAAAGSATAASGSAAAALASQNAAATSATNAATSETNAGSSKTAAAGSATASSSSASAALASQNAAKTSETNSKTSETNSKTSETNAAASATAASGSATSAAADRATVQGILVTLNALYLGNKTTDPTKDNNGNALTVGSEYFNSTTKQMRVYTSTGWQDVDLTSENMAANATVSASAASGSASAAATSATAASASQTAAAGSATAAAGSASAASTSQAAALASQNAAKTSETNSKTSETNSKTSETNAAASATAAQQAAATVGNPVSKAGDTMTGDLLLDGAQFTTRRYGNNGAIVLGRAEGTSASATAVAASNIIGAFIARGYDGSAYRDVGSINVISDGAISSTSAPGRLTFSTTPSGSVSTVERVRITSAGRVLMGTTTDDGATLLQVAGAIKASSAITATGGTYVTGAAGTYRGTLYQTSGVTRWSNGANTTAEGTNSGSDFSIDRYNDAGAWVDTPLAIARATGVVTLLQRPIWGATPWDNANVTPFDKVVGGTISAATSVDMASSATTAHLSLKASSGAISRESKLRFYGTFGSGADLGQRMVASIRSGFNGGTWGKEYLDFYLNSASNDAANDANQAVVMRLGYGGRVMIGTTTDDGSSLLQLGTGNLAFTGASQRILGDFTNATIASRAFFQTSTANSPSSVGVIPSGTGTSANFAAYNTADPTNSSRIALTALAGEARLTADNFGTGTLPFLTFFTNSAERMRVTTAGRVQIGTTTDTGEQLQVNGFIRGTSANLSGAAASYRGLWYQTNGVNRWGVGANQSAESSGSGSDFSIDRYNDAGTWLSTPLSISRSTGLVSLNSGLSVLSGATTLAGGLSATGGAFELGSLTAVQTPFVDFHSSGTGSDYDARIIASGGNSTAGNGSLTYLGLAGHTFTGNVTVGNNGTYSYLLKFTAGSYSPFMRGNNSGGIEIINSANTAYNMTITDGGVVSFPRARPNWAGLTPWDTGNLPSPASTNGLIYTSSHLRLTSGTDSTWAWSGQSGQPGWVWGGNDGANMYVWNPANFNVAYATNAGWATNAGAVGGVSNPMSQSGGTFSGVVTANSEIGAPHLRVSNSYGAGGGYGLTQGGGTMSWNDNSGDGAVWIGCNNAGAAGGIILRTVNSNNTAEVGRFTISGSGVGTNGSDKRLKKNIRTLKGSLAKIRKIRGVSYTYKSSGEKHYGVIAQEVQPHFPDAVTTQGAGIGEGRDDYLGVAYTDLVAPLIEAVKEVADKTDLVDPLVKAVKMLTAKLDSALARIATLEGAAA